MALIVQKFGGTSLGTLERINFVADKIIQTRSQGHQVVAVVSAMSGETDRLIQLARAVAKEPDPREYSVLVSTGEQVSMSLLCMSLQEKGCQSRSYTGGQAKITTTQHYKNARILHIDPDVLRAELTLGNVVVVAGFQGMDECGNITTLGRGGSDTTGVALAAALGADECQIYTDVDGVYTADPRVVPSAKRLNHITFEEMLELASLGAKVLQYRAVQFAGRYRVPLRVLSTFTEGPGTLITFEGKFMEDSIVSGIAYNRNEAKLSVVGVPDLPGAASRLLDPISTANIDVDIIIQNGGVGGTTNITFTVSKDDYQRAFKLLESTVNEMGVGEVQGDTKIAKLSLVGVGMRSHSGVASKMFSTLGKEGINIQLISTSEIKISVVIEEKYLELGVRTLHTAFGLDAEIKEEFDPKSPG